MSSPLDGRIRSIARAEAATLLGVGTPTPDAGTNPDRVAVLEQQLAELAQRVTRLEQAPTVTYTETAPKTRRAASRKTTEDSE